MTTLTIRPAGGVGVWVASLGEATELYIRDDADGLYRRACGRCGGSGRLLGFEHVMNAVCFGCNGGGVSTRWAGATEGACAADSVRRAKSRAAAEARRARKWEEGAAALEAERLEQAAQAARESEAARAAFAEEFPEAGAALAELRDRFPVDEDREYTCEVPRSWMYVAGLAHELNPRRSQEFAGLVTRVYAEAKASENAHHLDASEGEKVTVTGLVTRALWVETYFSYTPTSSLSLGMVTDDGAVVSIFTTAKWASVELLGQRITVTATVKRHEEYRGRPQTVLSRPKLIEP